MRLDRIALVCGGLVATIATAIACGDEDASSFVTNGDADGGSSSGGSAVDAGATPFTDGAVPSSGVVIVHSAAFPPFRLCFEGYPELAPQPDRTVMPEANVVGVEMGSAVRLGPLAKPLGAIYVINQRRVLAGPNATTAKSCGQLLNGGDLIRNADYHITNRVDAGLGVGEVSVLALAGCGASAFVENLEIDPAACGKAWDAGSGSIQARVITVSPQSAATEATLPVQVVHLSQMLEYRRGDAGRIEVTFGSLDGGSDQQAVSTSPPLFEPGEQRTLQLDQKVDAVYGTFGFKIAIVGAGPGAGFLTTQSLADVQDLSQSQAVPSTYFRAASNYALLLLGEPSMVPTLPEGGANPDYNPRRAVHLLAVPVRSPTEEPVPEAVADASVDR